VVTDPLGPCECVAAVAIVQCFGAGGELVGVVTHALCGLTPPELGLELLGALGVAVLLNGFGTHLRPPLLDDPAPTFGLLPVPLVFCGRDVEAAEEVRQ